MKGTPMIHCANCKILHSQPDPNSKAALRWQISELAEALIDWRNTYLCPISDIEESATRLLEATDAALAASGMDARQGGNEVPSRSDDSPTAESADARRCDPGHPRAQRSGKSNNASESDIGVR
jgi:hypothetical protein